MGNRLFRPVLVHMSIKYSLPSGFRPERVSLHGLNILVVGADSDLGNAISEKLASCGAGLILQASKRRNVNALYDRVVAMQTDPGSEEPLIAEIDLAKAETQQLNTLADGLGKTIEALDGLVYLPAASLSLSPVALTQDSHWQQAWGQGALAPLQLTRALLPLLGKARRPSVIYQSLAAGRKGRAYWSANGAASAALENIVQTLAAEYESIRFNTLDFAKTASALRHRAYPAEASSSLRRCDDPVLLATVLYLLSETADSGEQYALPDLN